MMEIRRIRKETSQVYEPTTLVNIELCRVSINDKDPKYLQHFSRSFSHTLLLPSRAARFLRAIKKCRIINAIYSAFDLELNLLKFGEFPDEQTVWLYLKQIFYRCRKHFVYKRALVYTANRYLCMRGLDVYTKGKNHARVGGRSPLESGRDLAASCSQFLFFYIIVFL